MYCGDGATDILRRQSGGPVSQTCACLGEKKSSSNILMLPEAKNDCAGECQDQLDSSYHKLLVNSGSS
jgi:hypothetical protein